jgi:hypothetical protein|tara:strand:+ start:1035 stop:2024 length:990 start_codon:yes stop_codon:yes gene_type:complete
MPDNEKAKKDLEVKLDDVVEGQEVDVPLNPLEKLQQEQEKSSDESKEEENIKDKDQGQDISYENEVKYDVETKPTEKIPAYSDDMPYSVKVRKRIQKEVAKRAEAEQRIVDLEQKINSMEKRTFDMANKSLSNQATAVSNELKAAIEEGNTDKQVKLYENLAEIRSQMTKTEDYAARVPKVKEKKEKAPPLATEWVKENSTWFNKPGFRKETAMAYGIDAELTEEGWDVHDPGYYDEMNKRLKASGLGHFNKSEENTSKKEQNVVQKTNRVQSPVAGVSRKKGTSSNRVKLTSDDLATAKNFGIDINDEAALKRFAKEVKSFSDQNTGT